MSKNSGRLSDTSALSSKPLQPAHRSIWADRGLGFMEEPREQLAEGSADLVVQKPTSPFSLMTETQGEPRRPSASAGNESLSAAMSLLKGKE